MDEILFMSKSDEDFEEQHNLYRKKVLKDTKNPQNELVSLNRTKNQLRKWYKHVDHTKELIHKLKRKTKNKNFTLLEREVANEERNRRANILIMARHKQCIKEEFHGIPKYIKDQELFIKSNQKRVHEECNSSYFKEQLKLNNAIHLHESYKCPTFDDLIVIGKKIESQKCIADVNELIKEELVEYTEQDTTNEEMNSQCSLALTSFERIDSLSDDCENSGMLLPQECPLNHIKDFINSAVARNVSMEILDSILNEIFKNNIFYLKMKYSSHYYQTNSESVEENIETPSLTGSFINVVQQVDSNKKSSSKVNQSNCAFIGNPDYMLTYIREKMKNKDIGIKKDDKRVQTVQNNIRKQLKEQSLIKAYWLNMFFIMDGKFNQLESIIGIIYGYNQLNEPTRDSSSIVKANSSSKNKINSMSRSQAQRKSKSFRMSASSLLSRHEKQLRNQIQKSQLFRSVIFSHFRYLILDALDFMCDVLSTPEDQMITSSQTETC